MFGDVLSLMKVAGDVERERECGSVSGAGGTAVAARLWLAADDITLARRGRVTSQ